MVYKRPRKKRKDRVGRPAHGTEPSPRTARGEKEDLFINHTRRPNGTSASDLSPELSRLQKMVGNRALGELILQRNRQHFTDGSKTQSTDQPMIFRQVAAPPQAGNAEPALSPVAQEVWDDHSNIHAHFGDDPAEFARQTRAQFDSNPSVRHHFDGLDSNRLGYRRIYPSYFALGITNPAQWIRDNIRSVQFMGRNVPVHRDLEASLAAIETNIREDPRLADVGANAGIVRIGGFVPRRIRGSTNLSHHSVGRAVDLNSGTNLRFLDLLGYRSARVRTLLKVIEAVTGVNLDSVTDYETQKAASDAFQARFATWLTNQQIWLDDFLTQDVVQITTRLTEKQAELQAAARDPDRRAEIRGEIAELKSTLKDAKKLAADQKKWLKKVKGVRRATDRLVAAGFLDLNEHVVQYFQDAGFEWGGEWSGVRKDFMHFQTGTVAQ